MSVELHSQMLLMLSFVGSPFVHHFVIIMCLIMSKLTGIAVMLWSHTCLVHLSNNVIFPMLELEETLPVQLFASILSICCWPRAAKSYFRSIYLSKTEHNKSWALLLALLVHGPQMRMCV